MTNIKVPREFYSLGICLNDASGGLEVKKVSVPAYSSSAVSVSVAFSKSHSYFLISTTAGTRFVTTGTTKIENLTSTNSWWDIGVTKSGNTVTFTSECIFHHSAAYYGLFIGF